MYEIGFVVISSVVAIIVTSQSSPVNLFQLFQKESLKLAAAGTEKCGDFDEISSQYQHGESFKCIDEKDQEWVCQIYEKMYRCDSTIFKKLSPKVPKVPQKSNSGYFVGSAMNLSESEISFLVQQFPGKNLTTNLLWRGSSDGVTFDSFHSKVDNQGQTITFFKSTSGNRFGGYISLGIQKCSFVNKSYNYFYQDNFAFLFNLDSKRKFSPVDL